MTESSVIFPHGPTVPLSSENIHCPVEQPAAPGDGGKKKQQRQLPRQLLSCTKCRERKVKCDRTKPCSACCARGLPKECHFVAEDGAYAPIQQSYELRKLRAENLRLKERLRASNMWTDDDEAERPASPDSRFGSSSANRSHKRRGPKQHRFQGPEWPDSLYFGSPGLANVINEFANMNVTSPASLCHPHLTHPMPVTRGVEMYAPRDLPLYPFGTLFSWSMEECIPQLLHCLPPKEELFGYLDAFERRVHVCFFPHMPTEITKSEVERFLSDAARNTEKCPDMLALLFAALALASQHSVWDKSGGKWVAGAMQEESKRGNLYIAAAMQALRMASYMNRPTLLGIQTLIMIGPYLTNSGRFLDAWTLFGTTIRLAQSIGLHRHPKYLDPAPPTQRECNMRQTLWWWMLHMDQQYSMTLGRPLGISGIGDCPPPYELTTDPTCLRFGEFVHQFTVLARHILGSDKLVTWKIDDLTDALRKLMDTLPEKLQFNESWLREETEIPEWPLGAMAAVFHCKTHNYLILLNRGRVEEPETPSTSTSPSFFQPVNKGSPSRRSEVERGRAVVLSSSEELLSAFLFFWQRIPAVLVCWSLGQQAFNSCMILILDALETGDMRRIRRVEQAYAIFDELDKKGVHKLANLAVERISWGLHQLQKMKSAPGGHQAADVSGTPMTASSMVVQNSGGDEVMQGPATYRNSGATSCGSEATTYSGEIQDTVMGNTGMILLEDPGLQSFVPEAFSPFTWVMAGDEWEGAAMTADSKEENVLSSKPSRKPRRRGQGNDSLTSMRTGEQCDDDTRTARSSGRAHVGQRSAANAGAPTAQNLSYVPYTHADVLSGPASTSPQSPFQSLTAPPSTCHSPGYATEGQQFQHGTAPIPQQEVVDDHMQLAHQPPHFRHHSYPFIPTLPATQAQAQHLEHMDWNRALDCGASFAPNNNHTNSVRKDDIITSTSKSSGPTADRAAAAMPLLPTRLGHTSFVPEQVPLQVHALHGVLQPKFTPQPAPGVHPSWAAGPVQTTRFGADEFGQQHQLPQGHGVDVDVDVHVHVHGMDIQEHGLKDGTTYLF